MNLASNRLPALPFNTMTSLPLVHLYAAANAFTCAFMPVEVTCLPYLRTLDVSTNALASLSFATTLSLPALQHLDVSSNRLADLPDGLCDSTNLAVLLAADNALTAMPEGMSKLQSLKTANFGCNNIRTINPCILDMPGLQTLVLGGNPLRERTHLSMSLEELRLSLAGRLQPQDGLFTGSVEDRHVQRPTGDGAKQDRIEEESFF